MTDQKYLIKFVHANSDLRFPELNSLSSLYDVKLEHLDYDESYPYLILKTDNIDKLFNVVKRSVLIVQLYQLIDCDEDKDKLFERLKNNQFLKGDWSKESFKIEIDTFNKRIGFQDKIQKIEELIFKLGLNGEINLKNPKNIFHLHECYNNKEPIKYYFAKYLIDSSRRLVDLLKLSERKFIANTSMDVELSLIMTNLAKVKENDLVLDCFAGSGSLLIAASKLAGALTLGTEISYNLIHGKSKSSKAGRIYRDEDENNFANYKQYGIEDKYVDYIISDSSLPLFNDQIKFDSIITDPPYCIRESAKRIGKKYPDQRVLDEHLGKHHPQKIEYNLYDIIKNLFNYSSKLLNLNGRLVFFYPISKPTYDETDLPTHSCFNIISHNARPLNGGKYLRLLICFEKIKEPDCIEKDNIPELTKQFKKIYHKLE